jgi:predicted Zn-dependent protease
MKSHPPVLRPLTAASLLAACSVLPLQPDRDAKAPRLEGFGQSDIAITSASAEARRLFNAGVLQAYAFNEKEAVRQFKAALAVDPQCAMCAWGVAWQLGPNINAPMRGDLKEARRYIAHAQRHADRTTARERALIDVMALRYRDDAASAADIKANGPGAGEVCASRSGNDKAHPLDVAYADRVRELASASPQDADLLSLSAEAAMVATQDDWWNETTGQPAPRIGEVLARLETLSAQQPQHTGLNHYLIHAADSRWGAPRAVGAADRLAALAPNAPHLVHMPSHTYARVGRYAEAAKVNQAAVQADDALDKVQADQGFKSSNDWRGHNLHFLWYASLMDGRGDDALAVARRAAERAKGTSPFAGYARGLPTLTLLRLERWDALLAEPLPTTDGVTTLMAQQARGIAHARRGQLDAARDALTQAEAATTKAKETAPKPMAPLVQSFADALLPALKAEIARAAGQRDEAVAEYTKAAAAAKKIDESEPPLLAAGARLSLAEAQLRADNAAAAEATLRADLIEQPDSGWALHTLARALAAQGKADEAAAVRQRLGTAWARADAALMGRS